MVDASKKKKAATKAKGPAPRPAPPVFDAADTEGERTAKWVQHQDDVLAWQSAQPVLTTWEELESIDDSNTGPLFIPEWGRNVVIRGLTREEYNTLDATCRQAGELDTEKMGRESMTLCLVQPRIAADAPIWKKNPMALKRIMDAILERSGVLGEVAAEVAAQFQS